MRLNMTQGKAPGLLITFCGLDGCGKTTMIHMLHRYLEHMGHRLMLTKQPTDFVRQSDIFRNFMDQPDHDAYDYRALSLLAASDRVQHTNRVIRPAIEEGMTVLSDRYFYSCLANLRARGYQDDAWIYEVAQSILMPDLSFFLDVPVPTAIQRVRSRPLERERYIDEGLQYRLREEYLRIAGENDGVVLDATRDIDETFSIVCQAVEKKLPSQWRKAAYV